MTRQGDPQKTTAPESKSEDVENIEKIDIDNIRSFMQHLNKVLFLFAGSVSSSGNAHRVNSLAVYGGEFADDTRILFHACEKLINRLISTRKLIDAKNELEAAITEGEEQDLSSRLKRVQKAITDFQTIIDGLSQQAATDRYLSAQKGIIKIISDEIQFLENQNTSLSDNLPSGYEISQDAGATTLEIKAKELEKQNTQFRIEDKKGVVNRYRIIAALRKAIDDLKNIKTSMEGTMKYNKEETKAKQQQKPEMEAKQQQKLEDDTFGILIHELVISNYSAISSNLKKILSHLFSKLQYGRHHFFFNCCRDILHLDEDVDIEHALGRHGWKDQGQLSFETTWVSQQIKQARKSMSGTGERNGFVIDPLCLPGAPRSMGFSGTDVGTIDETTEYEPFSLNARQSAQEILSDEKISAEEQRGATYKKAGAVLIVAGAIVAVATALLVMVDLMSTGGWGTLFCSVLLSEVLPANAIAAIGVITSAGLFGVGIKCLGNTQETAKQAIESVDQDPTSDAAVTL